MFHLLFISLIINFKFIDSSSCELKTDGSKKVFFCNKSLKLKSIPQKIDQNVDAFMFIGNELDYYKVNMVENFEENNLTEITIRYTTIKHIGMKTFDKLSNLKKLDLSYNLVEKLFKETFSKLKNLEELNLNNNLISELTTFNFYRLIKLKKLDLSFNKISFLNNKVLGDLKSLEILKLNNNYFHEINGNVIDTLKHIRKINLSNCNLEELSLSFYSKMKNLKVLDLSFNKIKKIDEGLFVNLTTLHTINLSSNNLVDLNKELFAEKNLELLNLSKNNLKKISESSFKNSKINKLILSENYDLGKVNLNFLNSIKSLKFLDLSYSRIDENSLIIKSIDKIKNEIISLNISNNFLREIPDLPKMKKLIEIDFSKNLIKTLTNKTIFNINKINSEKTLIYLHGNPFNCFNCDLIKLKLFIDFKNKCDENSFYCLKCYEPLKLRNYEIKKLNLTDSTKCGISMHLTNHYFALKSNLNLPLILIGTGLIIALFITLLIIYYKKIFKTIISTFEKKKFKKTYSKKIIEKSLSSLNLIKKNSQLQNQCTEVFKIDLPQDKNSNNSTPNINELNHQLSNDDLNNYILSDKEFKENYSKLIMKENELNTNNESCN